MGIWEDIAKPVISIGAAALGYELLGPIGGAIGWGVGMGVGGALYPSEAEKTAAMSFGPPQLFRPTSQYGMVIPVLRGCRRISGNLIWTETPRHITDPAQAEDYLLLLAAIIIMNNNEEPTDKYAVNFAYGICHGIAGTFKIYEGKKEYLIIADWAYLLNEGENVPPDYIGKTYDEQVDIVLAKGIQPSFYCPQYDGSQTEPDELMVATKGSTVPPYRNLHYMVFHDYPRLDETIPQLSFETARMECDYTKAPTITGYGDALPGPNVSDHLRFSELGQMAFEGGAVRWDDGTNIDYNWDESGTPSSYYVPDAVHCYTDCYKVMSPINEYPSTDQPFCIHPTGEEHAATWREAASIGNDLQCFGPNNTSIYDTGSKGGYNSQSSYQKYTSAAYSGWKSAIAYDGDWNELFTMYTQNYDYTFDQIQEYWAGIENAPKYPWEEINEQTYDYATSPMYVIGGAFRESTQDYGLLIADKSSYSYNWVTYKFDSYTDSYEDTPYTWNVYLVFNGTKYLVWDGSSYPWHYWVGDNSSFEFTSMEIWNTSGSLSCTFALNIYTDYYASPQTGWNVTGSLEGGVLSTNFVAM